MDSNYFNPRHEFEEMPFIIKSNNQSRCEDIQKLFEKIYPSESTKSAIVLIPKLEYIIKTTTCTWN
jgi:hypothetical protein